MPKYDHHDKKVGRSARARQHLGDADSGDYLDDDFDGGDEKDYYDDEMHQKYCGRLMSRVRFFLKCHIMIRKSKKYRIAMFK